MSAVVLLSEDEARAVVDLIEAESRRQFCVALTSGERQVGIPEPLRQAAQKIIQAFPSIHEEKLIKALIRESERQPTNVKAAAKCGLSVDAYIGQCALRDVETSAQRVRRERRERRSR